MPLLIGKTGSTVILRREAFEASGLARAELDSLFNLIAEEFRSESEIVTIGPIVNAEDLASLVNLLESRGLSYFDDFFELSGNWPEWLSIYCRSRGS